MKPFLLLILCIVTSVAAAQSQSGKITGYIPYDAGGRQILVFQVEGNVSGGCNTTSRFAVDSNAPKFKGTQTAVMAAFHTQTDVKVLYSQTCTAHTNTWDVVAVCVGPLPPSAC